MGVYDAMGVKFLNQEKKIKKGDKTHYIWSVKYANFKNSFKKHVLIADLDPRETFLLPYYPG